MTMYISGWILPHLRVKFFPPLSQTGGGDSFPPQPNWTQLASTSPPVDAPVCSHLKSQNWPMLYHQGVCCLTHSPILVAKRDSFAIRMGEQKLFYIGLYLKQITATRNCQCYCYRLVDCVHCLSSSLHCSLYKTFIYLVTSVPSLPIRSKTHQHAHAQATAGLEYNLGFLEKVFSFFSFFLYFSVQIRLDTKFPPRKNILYTIYSLSEYFQ